MNNLSIYLLVYAVVATLALVLEWMFAERVARQTPVDHTADLDAELRLLIESEGRR